MDDSTEKQMCDKSCVVGLAVGIVFFCLGVATGVTVFICCRRRRNVERNQRNQRNVTNNAPNEDLETATSPTCRSGGGRQRDHVQSVETNLGNKIDAVRNSDNEDKGTNTTKKYARGNRESVKFSPGNRQSEHEYEDMDEQKEAYVNVSFNHCAVPLLEIARHCTSTNIHRHFQSLEIQVKALHPQYSAEVMDTDPIYAVCRSTKGDKTAIFVDAFQRPNHFIVASQPNKELWDMIFDREVKIILQLDDTASNFYPQKDGDSYLVSTFELTRVKTEKNKLMSIIRLSVEGDDLYVLVVNSWANDKQGRVHPRFSSMNYYFDTLEEYETTGEVCIVDSDGFSKSGLFITAYNVVSQAQLEQKVDIHQTVYTARSRRPQFVSDVTSFTYLYHLARNHARHSNDS